MPRCAFLSIKNTDGWFIDDDLVHNPMQLKGWIIENISWDADVNWDHFDLVVVRSTWDYQSRVEAFQQVLNEIEKSSAVLLNSKKVIDWNIDKNYLFALEKNGIEIVPTLKPNRLTPKQLRDAFEYFYTTEIIVKPMIGANADDTFRINIKDIEKFSYLENVFKNRECMIQPFMKNIIEEGEYSVMIFDGKVSHVILKTTGENDFRVQEEHGGGVTAIDKPDPQMLEFAKKVNSLVPENTLYSRVDFVRAENNTFTLMELELIEPCLYFRFDKHAAERFATSINEFWKRQ